jgi:tetratricopeptide (TPR) repeat protein
MPEISLSYPPPKNAEDFDQLCCAIFRRHWEISELTRHGRSGHRQNGVDFYGHTKRRALFGGQSKLRSGADGLTKKEVHDEIKDAKTFEPPLVHFAIITSSKRDVSLQKLERQINLEHLEKSLFTFKIYFWDDLLEFLQEYQDIRDAYYNGSRDLKFEEFKDSINKQLFLREDAKNEGGLHAEIDEAANYLKQGNWRLARSLLERMRERKQHAFDAVEKYRVLANLGHTYEIEGKYDEAAKYFFQASAELPDDERSMVRLICAHAYTNDFNAAYELAIKLRNLHPENSDGHSLWVRNSPPDKKFTELELSIPPRLRNEANVAYELSRKALAERRFDDSEKYARVGYEKEPNDPLICAQLGTCLFAKQIALNVIDGQYIADNCGVEVLKEAKKHLSSAISSPRNESNNSALIDLLLKRAFAYEMLGDRTSRQADVLQAYKIEPSNTECLVSYALLLDDLDSKDQAIEILEAARASITEERPLLLLAQLLATRNKRNDRNEAYTIIKKIISDSPSENKDLGFLAEFFVRLAISTGKKTEIIPYLEIHFKNRISATLQSVLIGRTFLSDNHREDALQQALTAYTSVNSDTPRFDQLLLGRLFHSLQEHHRVVEVFKKILTTKVVDDDTMRMLEAAQKCDEAEFAIEFCEGLRKSNIFDAHCIDLELGLLQEFHCLERVFSIIDEISPLVNDDLRKELNVRRSAIAIDVNRPDLIETNPAELPVVENVNPIVGRMTVSVLRHAIDPMFAVKYAYQLVRQNFNDSNSRIAMVAALGLGLGDEERIAFPKYESIEIGTAVGFKENGSELIEWRIIEDLPEPKSEFGELSPNHPLAQEMIGKRVGDEFLLRKNAIQDRAAVVCEIIPKYVYRFRECLESWEERYPDQFFVQQIKVAHTPADDPDLTPIFKSIDQRIMLTHSIDQFYRDNPVSLHGISKAYGESIIATIQHISSQPDLPIRCTLFSDDDLRSFHKLPSAQRIVLDSTALATLFLTNSFEDVLTSNGPWMITEAVRREIVQWKVKIRENKSEGGFLTKIDNQHVYVRNDSMDKSGLIARFERFEKVVDERFIIIPGDGILRCGTKLRKELISHFGPICTQAIATAMQPGYLLWSDDLVVTSIAAHSAKCNTIWTQGIAKWLCETGQISSNRYDELCLKLLEMNYEYTLISPSVFLLAANKSNWNPSAFSLQKCIQWFSNRATQPENMFRFLLATIKTIWTEITLHKTTETITLQLLNQLSKRPDGRQMIVELYNKATLLFGIDVISADALREVIEAWFGTGGDQQLIMFPR